ncbi:hypothetical protein RRG08_011261 [Elysia crispata]|uniref:Uncharacterized protein n=1 Tax=Elysia crispata TaxID=231223 RepID=A0AAE1D1Q1_9GAST|nr:hypothetical protein RRG08_011261 [Elysia crispata]
MVRNSIRCLQQPSGGSDSWSKQLGIGRAGVQDLEIQPDTQVSLVLQVVVAVSTQSARPSRHVVVALAAQPRLSMIVYLSCYTGAKIVYLSLNLFNPAQYSYRGKENLSENVKRMGSDASKALYSVCHCPFLWDSPKMG